MKIHILGICGTFMGSIAVLARQLGHQVSGCDANVYPPMSTQLQQQGIKLIEGYHPSQLDPPPDLVIIGNAMSRGNDCVEAVLDRNIPFCSAPQWLYENVLRDRWVLAVAGTHGKTSTTAMLACILHHAGLNPGYLIGGVPVDSLTEKKSSPDLLPTSADLGQTPFFVIEADEYDCAFFDKRSKFIHYHPRTLILNNLEFDHADIFDDIEDIKKQFHHLVRIVPANGRIIFLAEDVNLASVIEKGCWSETEKLSLSATKNTPDSTASTTWHAELINSDASVFDVFYQNKKQGTVSWQHCGLHNVNNGLSAIAAAHHAGVTTQHAIDALNQFRGMKRRMEIIYQTSNLFIYDDFAHHPTAIQMTLGGLRKKVGDEKIIAVIEPRSNTMRMGTHKEALISSAGLADEVVWLQPQELSWDFSDLLDAAKNKQTAVSSTDDILQHLLQMDCVKTSGSKTCHIIIMSNGDFGGIHQKLLAALNK